MTKSQDLIKQLKSLKYPSLEYTKLSKEYMMLLTNERTSKQPDLPKTPDVPKVTDVPKSTKLKTKVKKPK